MPSEVTKHLHASIPVAKPANPVPQYTPPPPEPDDEAEPSIFTPEGLKGLGSSVALHAVLLLIMALWWFSPRAKPTATLDTRLAGSDMGVEDGLTLHGGLNSDIAMPEGIQSTPEIEKALSPATAFDLQKFELTAKNEAPGADKATGGGGFKNNNPGAGMGDGFGLAKFGSGGEQIGGVEVKVGDPQFTLIWDTEGVDLDLHVIEPGGKEIYWLDPHGKLGLGGELDVDNTKGFGPENIYWLKDGGESKEPGSGPPGEYKWFVHYYGGFGGIPKLSHWKVRVKHAGKVTIHGGRLRTFGEKSKIYTLHVEPRKGAATASAKSP
jgi:hypothetical protein